jgi:hypothetical protein
VTVNVSLVVNDVPVQTEHFVAGFLDHTVCGMIESLEGAGKVKNLILSIENDRVMINLNGVELVTNYFAGKIIKSTAVGMISNLKGVHDIGKIYIHIDK